MTPDQEVQLLEDVAVTRAKVETIEGTMVTHDRCKANREEWKRQIANGTLTTWRDRTWRVVTICVAVTLTGIVMFFASRAGG